MSLSLRKLSSKQHQALKASIIILIILYPFINAFLGLDLGDTGYHLSNFHNIIYFPHLANYSSVLTALVGALWEKLFGWAGLIGFNLLEVALELILCLVVYKTFKSVLGETTLLAGLLISIIASDTYLNIFNYHQFHVFLITIMLCAQYLAIRKNQLGFTAIAGCLFAWLVFARTASVTAIITLALYLYFWLTKKRSTKSFLLHMGVFAGSAAAGAGLFLGVLKYLSLLQRWVSDVFRLKNIAEGDEGAYTLTALLKTLIFDNLNAFASAFVTLSALILLYFALTLLWQKFDSVQQSIPVRFMSLIFTLIALYQLYYAFDVNPAEDWPQMTTGPRYLISMMYLVTIFLYIYHALRTSEKRHWVEIDPADLDEIENEEAEIGAAQTISAQTDQAETDPEVSVSIGPDISEKANDDLSQDESIVFLCIASLMLVVLTIAGSNTGTKHVILGLWLIAPVFVYGLKGLFTNPEVRKRIEQATRRFGLVPKRAPIIIIAVCFLGVLSFKFLHMIYYTTNYDSPNRFMLTHTVDHPLVRGIRTTERQATTLNNVLDVINEYDDDRKVNVFGASLLYYYLLDNDQYVRPWITQASYSAAQFRADLEQAYADTGTEGLPLLIYCRTNFSWGFEEEKLETNRYRESHLMYSGKKPVFLEFVQAHPYQVAYEDDYHIVFEPTDSLLEENPYLPTNSANPVTSAAAKQEQLVTEQNRQEHIRKLILDKNPLANQ